MQQEPAKELFATDRHRPLLYLRERSPSSIWGILHMLVGQARVGSVDFSRARMQRMAQAVLSLSTAPRGFTASHPAAQVQALGGTPNGDYGARQAAYDVKKLRAKKMVYKRDRSHRYEATPEGLRSITALWILRHKVIQAPAGCCLPA
jgi:hypothetical protein